jgi:hypothetical protein
MVRQSRKTTVRAACVWAAAGLWLAGCDDQRGPLDDTGDIGRIGSAITASGPIARMTCNGAFILNYNAPSLADFNAIKNMRNKPAFIVVDDTAATVGVATPSNAGPTLNAPGFFHDVNQDPSMKAIKILKYIPMNYGQIGNADTQGTGCPTRTNVVNLDASNNPICTNTTRATCCSTPARPSPCSRRSCSPPVSTSRSPPGGGQSCRRPTSTAAA